MKKGMYKKSNVLMRITAWVVIYAFLMLPSGVAFAGSTALDTVKIPMPPNLGDFVKDKKAAIQLGKALFWDQQVGGDGGQACASCHYRAGADPYDVRKTNQVNPGPNGAFNVVSGPNQTPADSAFPFVQVSNPATAKLENGLGVLCTGTPCSGTTYKDDVFGSMGVALHIFTGLSGTALDNGTAVDDPTFHFSRRVTGRNTPPAVGAVFNYANFWDGRANNIFNGSSPIGPLDGSAGIYVNLAGPTDQPVLQFQKVAIPNASAASQAVGPPNNGTEMSWDGRNFPQLARKMLGLTPLGLQHVDAGDSVLGGLANAGTGINKTYSQMIQNAFYEKYWDSFGQTIIVNGTAYSQMEANFSLFWGLSVMLYESLLVADQTPFDLGTMTAQQQAGFSVFNGKGSCTKCHSGAELSDATVSEALANGLIDVGQTRTKNAISDNGYHNLGVSPTAADIGRGGVGGSPFIQNGFSISSFAQEAIAQASGGLLFTAPQALPGGTTAGTPVAVNGSHKTPQLRNVGLTAPYMHNGSMLTLAEVVEFYARHGNFANAEQAKEMSGPFGGGALDPVDVAAIVDFLQNGLTDPRVAAELAPFDHPELTIPDGSVADTRITLDAKGGSLAGHEFNIDDYLSMRLCDTCVETMTLVDLPKATVSGAPAGTTNQTGATITVGGSNVVSYQYTLDGIASGATASVTAPISLTGLADGSHTLSVTGMDAAGHAQPASKPTTVTWTVKATLATPAMNPIVSVTRDKNVTISGTAEPGCTLSANAGPGVNAGPCTVTGGGAFTCQVSGMVSGNNIITVTATDAAGNTKNVATTVKVVVADGCFRGTGSPDITDSLKALKMSVGIVTPTTDDLMHGDVNFNNKMDSGDALLILKKSVGMASF